MVVLEEVSPAANGDDADTDAVPDIEEIPGSELSVPIVACDGLWLASEMALEEVALMQEKGITHLVSFGSLVMTPDALVAAFEGGHHVYARAENGALVTHLRSACDFIGGAIAAGGRVAAVSEEEGEAGTAFVVAAFLVVERGMTAEAAAEAVLASRPTNPLRGYVEFMKNLRFLGRNGIPDWA